MKSELETLNTENLEIQIKQKENVINENLW